MTRDEIPMDGGLGLPGEREAEGTDDTGTGIGITLARQRAEQRLRDSETRYRRLFESAKDGILILDADTGQVVDVNPFLTQLLGYSHGTLCGKHIWEIGAFKDIAASKAAFETLQRNEYIRYETLPLETHDGRRVDVEFVSNVYLVDHTKVIQCNIRDITERTRAEQALRDNENKFKYVFDYSVVGKSITLPSGKVQVNKAFCRMLGYSQEEFANRNRSRSSAKEIF